MSYVISHNDQNYNPNLETFINTNINGDDQGMTFIESAAYSALKNAMNKSKESFTLSNVVPLYNFVSRNTIQFQYRNTDFNLYHKIYKQFKTHFNLNIMPNVQINENVLNTNTMLNVIVKLMCYLINNQRINSDNIIEEMKNNFNSQLTSEEEKSDLQILIKEIPRPAYLLTAFKLLYNSYF